MLNKTIQQMVQNFTDNSKITKPFIKLHQSRRKMFQISPSMLTNRLIHVGRISIKQST